MEPDNVRELREKIIRKAFENDEFHRDVDGYFYWWPSEGNRGFYTSHALRFIADELDIKNGAWEKHLAEANDLASEIEKKILPK